MNKYNHIDEVPRWTRNEIEFEAVEASKALAIAIGYPKENVRIQYAGEIQRISHSNTAWNAYAHPYCQVHRHPRSSPDAKPCWQTFDYRKPDVCLPVQKMLIDKGWRFMKYGDRYESIMPNVANVNGSSLEHLIALTAIKDAALLKAKDTLIAARAKHEASRHAINDRIHAALKRLPPAWQQTRAICS